MFVSVGVFRLLWYFKSICFYSILFSLVIIASLGCAKGSSSNLFSSDKKISFHQTIQEVSPAVVSIYASNNFDKKTKDNLSKDILNKNYSSLSDYNNQTYDRSIGSGVIISPKGLVVTNSHVINNRKNILVITNSGQLYEATCLVNNVNVDLALLQIKEVTSHQFPYLKLENQDTDDAKAQVGDMVLAIGNPFGIGQTVTIGIISGFRYFEKDREFAFSQLIQIDALINPGNSGGALIDTTGRLIGINSMVYAISGKLQSHIGFAIPSRVVKLFIDRYFNGSCLKKYWIGLKGISVGAHKVTYGTNESAQGVYVEEVTPHAPASIAGLQKGDIIIKFGNVEVTNISTLTFAVASIDSPAKIAVTFKRGNKLMHTEITPEIPAEVPKMEPLEGNGPFAGTVLVNNSPFVAYQINSDVNKKGIVIYSLDSNSLFKKLSLKVGDIICQVNGVNLNSTKDLKDYLSTKQSQNTKWDLVIERDNETINVKINSNYFGGGINK